MEQIVVVSIPQIQEETSEAIQFSTQEHTLERIVEQIVMFETNGRGREDHSTGAGSAAHRKADCPCSRTANYGVHCRGVPDHSLDEKVKLHFPALNVELTVLPQTWLTQRVWTA